MNDVRYFYLKNGRSPIACVAIKKCPQSSSIDKVYFGVSTCNPADDFKKPLARAIACGRLNVEPMHTEVLSKSSHVDITRAIMHTLTSNINMPARVRRAAQVWLSEDQLWLNLKRV